MNINQYELILTIKEVKKTLFWACYVKHIHNVRKTQNKNLHAFCETFMKKLKFADTFKWTVIRSNIYIIELQ